MLGKWLMCVFSALVENEEESFMSTAHTHSYDLKRGSFSILSDRKLLHSLEAIKGNPLKLAYSAIH